MQPPMIVEAHPVDRFIHCRAAGREAHAVHARHLRRAPQAFGGRVVPAVALAARRGAHAVAASAAWSSWLQYWLLRLEWKINPGAGCRLNHAILTSGVLLFDQLTAPSDLSVQQEAWGRPLPPRLLSPPRCAVRRWSSIRPSYSAKCQASPDSCPEWKTGGCST